MRWSISITELIKIEIWNKIWPVLIAIVIFGLIIFIHEFGHFIFAKLFKIKVNQFAIGFGPAIFKFHHGETLYAIRILPLGGYCAMEGENGESADERAFSKAKVWQRIIVCAAGAIFNIILGFAILLTIVGLQSDRLASTTVSKFYDNATSCGDGGLQIGDKIEKINGRNIFSADDLNYMLALSDDGFVSMQVQRDGEKVDLPQVKFTLEEYEGHIYMIRDFYVSPIDTDIFGLIKEAGGRTLSMARYIIMSLCDLVTGKYGLQDVSGPVGITNIMSQAVTSVSENGVRGLIYLLRILSLITINLGVFNLLPLPALDGSRILFLVIEGIRRKPIPPEKEGIVHAVGMLVLLIFMGIIIVKDIFSLF